MTDYYAQSLYGEALKKCYDIAPPRVNQYLEAEIQYLIDHVNGLDLVLELGCGYGRVMKPVSGYVGVMVGIDTAEKTLLFGNQYLSGFSNCYLLNMDASHLGFNPKTFDAVFCIQNGLSAFRVDTRALVKEAITVTRPGGLVLFSSYSPRFWEHRLEWFRLQAKEGLIGEIDELKTKDGIIVCKDGLRLTYVKESQFLKLFTSEKTEVSVTEVDESSVFCTVHVL
jgi:2-polyprenyl-6-hydroxyphenyl methylase/3-demethylubiquinone-9 3-methyltransferase